MQIRTLVVASLAIVGVSLAALAQHHGQHGQPAAPKAGAVDHSKMNHGQPGAATLASTAAFQAANARMHKDMDIAFSGNADVDFVKGMIPHHQGAIDMAKVVLAHGKDAETRKLASEIIVAQEKEIAMMKAWLKAKGQ